MGSGVLKVGGGGCKNRLPSSLLVVNFSKDTHTAERASDRLDAWPDSTVKLPVNYPGLNTICVVLMRYLLLLCY